MSYNKPCAVEPFFLPFGQHSLFCLYHAAATETPRAAVLYLPPFAEEMHKSRRMAALQSRRFAQSGYAVLQIDLLGCGDSSGDFAEASWEAWLACARAGHDWLRQKTQAPVVLWGSRLGAALAAELSLQLPEVNGLLLWQPVPNGENFLNQFLRIRVASEMFAERKTGLKELRAQLAGGEALEVGGYLLTPRLASGIDKLRLAQLAVPAPVRWLEVSPTPADQPPPASQKTLAAWSESGVDVIARTVTGDPFWATQEITECPELLRETLDALENITP